MSSLNSRNAARAIAAFVSALSATIGAQAPIARAIATSHCLVADGDRCIAEGVAYRAVFTADGVDFTPALGERAPRAQHLRLRLQSVLRGPAPVLSPEANVSPALEPDAVAYARGAVYERFAVRADGLLLSLHFAAPLPGEGDLVARYAVETDLPFAGADGEGVHFALPTLGGVYIGQVTGIDADGRKAPGTLRAVDGGVEFVLPHEFVARARYPLVLDPLIGTEFQAGTATDVNGEPDAAFDASTGRYLVVWRRTFGSDHRSIRGQLVDSSGASVGSLLLVRDQTPLHCHHPSVANVASRDHFLVVWGEASAFLLPSTIRGRGVAARDAAMSSVVTISNQPGADSVMPCAAGDAGSGDSALVVWSDTISARLAPVAIAVNGSLTPGTNLVVSAGGFGTRAVISRSHGANSRYVVAWQNGTVGEVWARTYDRSLAAGVELRVLEPIAVTEEFRGLAIDGDGTDFVLAFGQTRGPLGQRDVRCASLRADANGALQLMGTIRDLESSPAIETFDPAVACLGPKFAVAWTRVSEADTHVEGIELAADCSACGTAWSIAGANTLQGKAAFATERAGGITSNSALLVCSDARATIPFSGQLRARRLTAFGPGRTPVVGGAGCGGAGLIGAEGGPFVLGNRDFRLLLAGAPAGVGVVVDIGLPGNELPCGTCLLTNGFLLQPVGLVGSEASFPLPVPCALTNVGLTLSAQWLVLGAGGTSCPLVPGLAASARLHLTISE